MFWVHYNFLCFPLFLQTRNSQMTCYTNKHTIQKALKSKASVCFCMQCAYPFFISSLITLIFVNSTSVCGNASSSMFVFLLVSSVFEDSLLMRYNFFKGNFSLKILLLISKNKTNTQIYNMLYYILFFHYN